MTVASVSGAGRLNPSVVREAEDLCKAQAIALHNWVKVEDSLGQVFAALMRSPDGILPFAALSAVQFDAKVRIVDTTAKELLRGHALLEDWRTRKNEVAKYVKDRNVLAHCRIELFGDQAGLMWRLYPAASNISSLRKSGDQREQQNVYDAKRLQSFSTNFETLAQHLFAFSEAVADAFPLSSE